MNIRTLALSIALAAAALTAPPVISDARACGGYGSPEMLFSWAAAHEIATRWGVARDKVEVIDIAFESDDVAAVDVRIHSGENHAFRRRYVVARGERSYRVTVTPVAWVERLTKDGWARA